MIIHTPIIPPHSQFVKVDALHELDKKAICIFAATGFFLNRDTYWKDEAVLPPASISELDAQGYLKKSIPVFQWYYSPREITFEKALEEFTELFEAIIEEQVGEGQVILPLSGGLDSRTQAVALQRLNKKVHAFSYKFKNGYPETRIAKQIAARCGFTFEAFKIGPGYLWEVITQLAELNDCYSEFTHPRQMAVYNEFDRMGDVFSLGHWGDVLFDSGAPEGISEEALPSFILKKIIKKGGMELAVSLWNAWGLEGTFEAYLKKRINGLLEAIPIENISAKARAFKSLHWAPRWTATNLVVFSAKHPVGLPYFDDRMCRFICTLPETYLADRKLQIAYIKQHAPGLARLTWQAQKPFNLYDYGKNRIPFNIPYRIIDKLQRETRGAMGMGHVQRNWELQFTGAENDRQLSKWLYSKALLDLVPETVVRSFHEQFKNTDAVAYSHPVSMLLTLALKMNKGS